MVVAFGQILKPEVLDLPSLGSINIHGSLLPELRGAAPVHWAIIRGFDETGVTIMRMEAGLDSGPILFQVPEPIRSDESMSDLALRLSEIGAEALIETLAMLEGSQRGRASAGPCESHLRARRSVGRWRGWTGADRPSRRPAGSAGWMPSRARGASWSRGRR